MVFLYVYDYLMITDYIQCSVTRGQDKVIYINTVYRWIYIEYNLIIDTRHNAMIIFFSNNKINIQDSNLIKCDILKVPMC